VSELDRITALCIRLGAPPAQAATMARQLLKRADQIAAERGISRETALAQLLQILVEGRQGNVPPEFRPPASSEQQP
jgi:hypothetical protein